jgi:hypothetical protein
MPEVTIEQTGRGGSIYYREGENTIVFDWEFGGSALALLFGVDTEHWDARYPWAIGRQAEIYDFVAKEVVRQQASGHRYKIDLASGDITIL